MSVPRDHTTGRQGGLGASNGAATLTESVHKMTALLFCGQGERGLQASVQRGLQDEAPLFMRALNAAGVTPSDLSDARTLEQSRILQPVLTALSLTEALQLRERGFEADYVAGHSLGELAAWAFAGAMKPQDAVDLAAVRGRAMGRAANNQPGGMLALTDTEETELDRILEFGRPYGAISVAAYNAPNEFVLTGSIAALQAVAHVCRSKRLAVEGAWHSPLMSGAKHEFAAALEGLSIAKRIRPLISSIDGARLDDTDEIVPRLLAQLIQPLHWTSVLATLSSLGVERFVIAGPGRVLRYLVRRNLPTTEVALA